MNRQLPSHEALPEIFSIPFDPVTPSETLAIIGERLDQQKVTRIVTINSEFILAAEKNPEFKKVLQTAGLHLADGIGVVWAASFLDKVQKAKSGKQNFAPFFLRFIWSLFLLPFFPKSYQHPLPARVTGVDLFTPLMELLAHKKQTVFLLGAAPGVAEQVANTFRIHPGLGSGTEFRILTHSGSPNDADAKTIIKLINDSQATALFVAFQFPRQDMWIAQHLAEMPNIKVAMGVGGTFDFIAGTAHIAHRGFKAKRAPRLLQKLNLEWLWRLITQPFRWKRIFGATFVFMMKVYRESKK